MANIKEMLSVDKIKTLFLKHGEKLVLGGVGLFVLMSLAGTQWSTYKKVPGQLTQQLEQADETIEKKSPWTEEEKDKYPLFSPKDQVQEMLAEMSSSPFNFTTELWTPPGGQTEAIKEVITIAVTDLIVSPGRTLLAQHLDPVSEDTDEGEPSDTDGGALPDDGSPTSGDPDSEIDDDVRERAKPTGAIPGMAGDSPFGVEGGPGAYPGDAFQGTMIVEGDPNAFLFDEPMDGEGMDGGMMAAGPAVKGVPVRYNSVRGIFDLQKQIQNYARALQTDEASAESLVEFIDFRLERQIANSPQELTDDLKWELVDINVALDYLKQAVDWDQDPVPAAIRNDVLTTGLPARLLGVWRNKVTHSKIENYTLSDKEMEFEARLNQKIMEDHRKNQKAIVLKIQPGGFSKTQLNMNTLQEEFLGATDDRQLTKTFENEFEGTPAQIQKKMIEKIREQVTAAGSLILFRYIDFDVQPGKSYRYRVQLVLRNPSFGTPVDQVNTPSVVEGQIRTTPMSEPSNIASIKEDSTYFLSTVYPPRGISSEIAEMTVYQWFNETGTIVRDTLSVELGDHIGGKGKTHVLRPAEMEFEEESNVLFTSDDLLIDAIQISRLDPNLHADLITPKKLTRGDTGISPEVLIIDPEGRFKSLFSFSSISKDGRRNVSQKEKTMASEYDLEKKPFDFIKDAKTKAPLPGDGDSLFGPEGGDVPMDEMSEEMMEAGTGRFRGRRGSSSRLRGLRSETETQRPRGRR